MEEKMTARAGTGVNKKRTSSQRVKEEEKREKTEKLNAQKSALGSKLAAVDALRSGVEIPALEGREVEHVSTGQEKSSAGRAVIAVQYGDVTKKQKLPFVVAGGLMHLKDADMETSLTRIEELTDRGRPPKEMQYLTAFWRI